MRNISASNVIHSVDLDYFYSMELDQSFSVGLPVIETDRLNLRCINYNDVDQLHFLRTYPPNQVYLDRPLDQSKLDTKNHIDRLLIGMENRTWINWAMATKTDDVLIGSIGFVAFSVDRSEAEIGYELHPDYQRKGLMSEAMQSILSYGWEQLQLRKIDAIVHEENANSIALLERFGFHSTGKMAEENPKVLRWSLKRLPL